MGKVRFGQAGYVGVRMSENAMYAYEDGEMPKSRWTKRAMLDAIEDWCDAWGVPYDGELSALRKQDLFARFFEWKSWHHTGKFANETDFYGLDEEALGEYMEGRAA